MANQYIVSPFPRASKERFVEIEASYCADQALIIRVFRVIDGLAHFLAQEGIPAAECIIIQILGMPIDGPG
jgi:hypothetical protein